MRKVAESIGIALESLAPLRREEFKLENQAKALRCQIKEMEAQDNHAAKAQARQLELQQVALDQQEKQLTLEAKQPVPAAAHTAARHARDTWGDEIGRSHR